tara:strand:- start:18 stop:398 length:381 start_codon:yes stop_codon:yes gene_type:complete
MLKRLDQLEKQHGGAIPFSALKDKKPSKKSKTKKKKKIKKKKKRTISPSRAHRKVTKKTKRSKKKTMREKKDKTCSCGSHTYTGKEKTPEGLGKCPECIPLGVVMKGADNKLYRKEDGPSRWVKIN